MHGLHGQNLFLAFLGPRFIELDTLQGGLLNRFLHVLYFLSFYMRENKPPTPLAVKLYPPDPLGDQRLKENPAQVR